MKQQTSSEHRVASSGHEPLAAATLRATCTPLSRGEAAQTRARSAPCSLLATRYSLLILTFATVALVAGTWGVAFLRVNQSIPFDSLSIGPDGEPRLKLFGIDMDDGLQGGALKLAHMLAFDGGRYFSDFYMPVTTTTIIRRDKDSYIWRDLQGRAFLLNTKPSEATERWSVEEMGSDMLLVRATKGEERYIYSGGQLREAQYRGARLGFSYEDKHLTRIVVNAPSKQTTLEFSYDLNGRLDAIESANERASFLRDEDGVLTGISVDNGSTLDFTYSDGLLTGAECDGETSMNWKWGTACMMHGRPRVPLPPMLCSDGTNNYEVFYDGNITKVRWTQIETGITKKWDYLGITDRMKVRAF
jgi:hypothetical protein